MKNSCNKCESCSSYVIPGTPCVSCSGTACQEIYYSSCVIYTGDCLSCYGIEAGENLTAVIDKLLDLIYGDCTPSSTTTSTTTISPTTTSTTIQPTTTTTTLFSICDDCH
jgi:hypothetical protein